MSNIEQQQKYIIDRIKEELAKKEYNKPSSFTHSVWFVPETGRFLFNDMYIMYEVIEPLIEKKTLVFKSIENHQGEKMIRYVLS